MSSSLERLWQVMPPAPASLQAELPGLAPVAVQLLYNRGIRTRAQAEAFIAPSASASGDPMQLPDMWRAVERTRRALASAETIAVYGDFDADGITATAVLSEGLEHLGATPIIYIPDRVSEGHGLNSQALDWLRSEGARLVITGDCGVTGYPEVAQANQQGMDVIITDHHQIPGALPPALAVVNPHRKDSAYGFADFTGVGTAYKFLQALCTSLGKDLPESLLELVAIGTLTDQAPLVQENRLLVKRGLELLNRTSRPGLKALMQEAGIRPGEATTESILFGIGPRLNAAGRLYHALPSYQLLRSSDYQQARSLASQLATANYERRRLTEDLHSRVRSLLDEQEPLDPILLVIGDSYPVGVLGLVASKLVETFYRPAVVMRQDEELVYASARSIPEFDIAAALTECSDLFLRFGGHPQAGGFTMRAGNLRPLRQRLLAQAARELASLDLRPKIVVDMATPLAALAGDTYQFIRLMEPFGPGNPQPTFLSRGVAVKRLRQQGARGEHLSLTVKQQGITWHGIGFGLGERQSEITPELDLVYRLRVDTWDEPTLGLEVLDFRPAGRGPILWPSKNPESPEHS